MNKRIMLCIFISICVLPAILLTQFIMTVKASPYTNVSVSEAKAMIDSDPDLVILDVRYLYEYEDGHIKNAIPIPLPELESRLNELDKEKETLVYCRSGGRSAAASGILDSNGFTSVYNMQGGILAWIGAGYPIEIVFGVTWEEATYPVATFSNSTIDGFGFKQPLKLINFTIAGSESTFGFCNVTIPLILLSGDFSVLIDEIQTDYTLTQDTTHSFIYFAYSHTSHQVKIIGTSVIGTHNLEITSLDTSKTIVGEGYEVTIQTEIFNCGDYTEDFNVTVYVNTTIISECNITLLSGNSTIVTYTWNTTGYVKGNYIISAYVTPVEGEINTLDNNYTDGTVLISILGDVNGDYIVDVEDYQLVKIAIPSWPDSPKWNPNADLNDDGLVDVTDYQMVKSLIGTVAP